MNGDEGPINKIPEPLRHNQRVSYELKTYGTRTNARQQIIRTAFLLNECTKTNKKEYQAILINTQKRKQGMEKAINDVPLEFFEDLKDLIDGEIIFRKKDKDDSFESHLLGESENIH